MQVVIEKAVAVSLQIDLNAIAGAGVFTARLRSRLRRRSVCEVLVGLKLAGPDLMMHLEWLEMRGHELPLEERERGLLGRGQTCRHLGRVETLYAVRVCIKVKVPLLERFGSGLLE